MIKVEKIRGCMAEHGHTQQDIAKILNISKVSVNSKLNGKTDFTISEISALCSLYKKKISYFLS